MVNETLSFKIICVFGVAMLLLPSMMLSAEISGVELLNLLSEKDQISNSIGYKTSFMMASKARASDPKQGMVAMDCQASWTADSFAMKITNHYEHPPVFAPPESQSECFP